jgi:hypothetical protein
MATDSTLDPTIRCTGAAKSICAETTTDVRQNQMNAKIRVFITGDFKYHIKLQNKANSR